MSFRKYRNPLSIALAALVLLVLGPSPARAEPLKTLGFDDMSCQVWKQSKDDADQRALYIVWIRGLLTGYNYARPSQQVSTISSGTIEQWVNRYCNDNPASSFSDAALRLSDQYSGRKSAITK
ncbi:hypothetical protein [Dechloromonas sp. A34]|uniref:hypothetical protein n=1 Tax=Dechloromonas sp. A34 TaxID=447588 RepID=UPI0022488088|nr:hypothetical protein [Dechloromonas sp. A34]